MEKRINQAQTNEFKLLIFRLCFIERLLQNGGYFKVYSNKRKQINKKERQKREMKMKKEGKYRNANLSVEGC